MAFTKTPTGDTYQTKIVPFQATWETRDRSNNKDVFSQNVVWEQIKDPSGDYYECMKRDGTTLFATLPVTEEIGGMWYYQGDITLPAKLIVITTTGKGYTYFLDGTLDSTFTVTASIRYHFTEFLFDSGQVSVIIAPNSSGWYVLNPGSPVTPIVDVDFPTNAVPYPVFLDGFLFAANIKGEIYNSNLNDPLTWTASGFTTAESYPDQIVAIARNGQYIVAFGITSIQFFYDAANPTGTPLATQTTALQIGFIGGLVAYGEALYFIGQTTAGQPELFKLQGLQAEALHNTSLTRLLVEPPQGIFSRFGILDGSLVHFNGYPHYVPLATQGTSPHVVYPCPVYNLTSQTWTYLAIGSDSATSTIAIGNSATFLLTINTSNNVGYISVFSRRVLSGANPIDNKIYKVSQTAYQDTGVDYSVIYRTQNLDYGTRRIKFGSRLLLNCDQTANTSFMGVRYTTDDYQTYSTLRNVDLANIYPNVPAIGQFRKIAFEFTYTSGFPMRWQQAELDYNLGGA